MHGFDMLNYIECFFFTRSSKFISRLTFLYISGSLSPILFIMELFSYSLSSSSYFIILFLLSFNNCFQYWSYIASLSISFINDTLYLVLIILFSKLDLRNRPAFSLLSSHYFLAQTGVKLFSNTTLSTSIKVIFFLSG